MERSEIARVEDLRKNYRMGEVDVPVLQGVSLSIQRGAFHAILGRSGSGKTTLLNLLGALDTPSSGRIFVDGADITRLSEVERTRFRREKLGFIFQFFNLVPLLTALENVELGLEVDPELSPAEVRSRSVEVLQQVGLDGALDKYPAQLSGGQQQRVAIARALAKRPTLVLCDEPTGNLDARTAETVVELMEGLNQRLGSTFVIVTHSLELARRATEVTEMVDGAIRAHRSGSDLRASEGLPLEAGARAGRTPAERRSTLEDALRPGARR